jgi:hypothetical protein
LQKRLVKTKINYVGISIITIMCYNNLVRSW